MGKFKYSVFFLFLLSCKQKINDNKQSIQTNVLTVTDSFAPEKDIFCDLNKIKDFKNNLNINQSTVPDLIKIEIEKKAEKFIDSACSQDSLFCGKIKLELQKVYSFKNTWKFYLAGFRFIDNTYELNSASFFVISFYKNNQFYYNRQNELYTKLRTKST